uniref:Uncharacterized protein n=1 Tax=Odontella aurita TaxID=265563 RepID=A0A7S4N0V2_9STRA|mmetsp:Transcript_43314/g.131792  ORF Transcript_43314/g.131792 Transcript_43314/m.131792 type:complete len:239 (+) Transcript_43314:449-1165(+)
MLNPTQFVFLNGMFHFRFPNCYCIFPTLLFPAHARYAVSVRWEREMEEEESRRREGRKKTRCTCTHEDFHTLCCCGARRIGGMFMLMEKRDGSPVVIAGPCWPFCTFITLPLIVVLSGLVSYFVVLNRESPLPWWFAFIYFPILGLTLLALFCVSCRDPGLLERVTDEEAGHGGWFWNEQVGSFRPPGAMYCRECKVRLSSNENITLLVSETNNASVGFEFRFSYKTMITYVHGQEQE